MPFFIHKRLGSCAALRNNTDKIYSDIISERLRTLDEKELTRSQKLVIYVNFILYVIHTLAFSIQ